MSVTDLLEAGAALGSIVGVWFALVGWKLLSLTRTPPERL